MVRLIFQWYTDGEGDDSSLSLYAIAKKLSLAGIPAPSHTNRRNARNVWNGACISRILKSTTYKGQWCYNADNRTKREILDVFDAKITVKDGSATLSYSLPTPVSIELHLS